MLILQDTDKWVININFKINDKLHTKFRGIGNGAYVEKRKFADKICAVTKGLYIEEHKVIQLAAKKRYKKIKERYGEPTKRLTAFSCPVSKVDELNDLIYEKLKSWEI